MPNLRHAHKPSAARLLRAAIGVAMVAAAAVGIGATLSAVGANSATVQQISSDPYAANSTSQHHTEVEPDMYSFGSTVVATFQAGRFFSGGGSSNIGWATSTDAGATWTSGFLPSLTIYATPPGQAARATDPAVSFDRKSGT